MKKLLLSFIMATVVAVSARAQVARVYDEGLDPMAQIDSAVAVAARSGKYVICQVGGNWCPWCLRFADFIKTDEAVAKVVADNFVYIHVNYPRSGASEPLAARLGNPARFGFPVMVVLGSGGDVLHIQDSSFLEEGKGYTRERVLRFFNCWTPQAVEGGTR